MSSPLSIFAEGAKFLTHFNPDHHLDDSYLQALHHPQHIPSFFYRRKGQLPIVGDNSPLGMDPSDWRYMIDPNHPFHFITNKKLHGGISKPPKRPLMGRQKTTNYYVEQMHFFEAAPGTLPEEETEPMDDICTPGPLKFSVLLGRAFLITTGCMMFTVVMIGVEGLRKVGGRALRPFKNYGEFPWETLCFALAASQLLRFLPGMEGKAVGEVWKANPPLYVIMLRNPNQWIREAVTQG